MKGLVAIAIAIGIRKKRLAVAEPAIQFSETPHAENEPAIAVRGSRLPPPPSPLLWYTEMKGCTICFKINIIKSLFTLTHNYIEYTVLCREGFLFLPCNN